MFTISPLEMYLVQGPASPPSFLHVTNHHSLNKDNWLSSSQAGIPPNGMFVTLTKAMLS